MTRLELSLLVIASCLLGPLTGSRVLADERVARFDADPHWDGTNNRSRAAEPRLVRQDFGYSTTSHAGRAVGEMGGFISPAAEPAYYARRIPRKTFDDKLTASGVLACEGESFHVLIGFFNSRTVNEWRTPNTIALRLLGRGDVFYAFVEYTTSRWRAGGDSPGGFATVLDEATGKKRLRGFASGGKQHVWSLTYDPAANGGAGSVTATVDDETAVCVLDPGHRTDGAELDHFGLLNVMKSADGGGKLWLDDVAVLGDAEDFHRDPGWDGVGNRQSYVSKNVRPCFDFGFSATSFAGGESAGEIGGLVFRGDCRFAEKLACYGDKIDTLRLERPLRASGRVCLRRGVSDSTTLFGFFHSSESLRVNDSQSTSVPRSFLGISIGGPSREGFLFQPACNLGQGTEEPRGATHPRILPDGTAHDWTFEYAPRSPPRKARLTVTLDGDAIALELRDEDRADAVELDRFGIVTTWVDGNAQEIYFDDITYTGN